MCSAFARSPIGAGDRFCPRGGRSQGRSSWANAPKNSSELEKLSCAFAPPRVRIPDFWPAQEPYMMDNYSSSVILEPQEEGGFTVLVPALPEVVTEGDSEAEALANAEEAIRAILAYRRDNGIPI